MNACVRLSPGLATAALTTLASAATVNFSGALSSSDPVMNRPLAGAWCWWSPSRICWAWRSDTLYGLAQVKLLHYCVVRMPRRHRVAAAGKDFLPGARHRIGDLVTVGPLVGADNGARRQTGQPGRVRAFHGMPFLKDGKRKALSVSDTARVPQLPNVKCIGEEEGFSGMALPLWQGLFLRVCTPAAVVAAYEKDLLEVVALPGVEAKMKEPGITAATQTGAEFHAFF